MEEMKEVVVGGGEVGGYKVVLRDHLSNAERFNYSKGQNCHITFWEKLRTF